MAPAVILKKDGPAFSSGQKVIKRDDYALYSSLNEVMDQARENAARIVKEAEALMANELAIEAHQRDLAWQTVDLVMAVVHKVLLDIDPRDLVAAQLKKALENMKTRKKVLIRTHPANAELLNQKLADIMSVYPGIKVLEVKPDTMLAPDNMVLESETGIVDASMKTQLAAIEKAFRQHVCPVETSDSDA